MTIAYNDKLERFSEKILATTARPSWLPFALAAVIGVLDFFTGPDLSFGIFYLLPIIVVAWWYNTRRIGIIIAIAAIIWLSADLGGGHNYAHPLCPYWNALTRLGIFLIVGFAIHFARHLHVRQMDLVNYVVHDLRNPLMTFTNTLEIIAENDGKESSPSVREYVELCRVASYRMGTLIDSMLDLARLEEGQLPVDLKILSVSNVVQRAIYETTLFAQSKNITIREEIKRDAKPVRADAVILHRILVNLLTNAISVSPKNTTIRVKVEDRESDTVVFAVVDSGPGIPHEYVSRVFDKFVQIQMRKSRRSTGFGLGLAFCRLATIAQHGQIWIENIANNGASVFIAFPAAEDNLGET